MRVSQQEITLQHQIFIALETRNNFIMSQKEESSLSSFTSSSHRIHCKTFVAFPWVEVVEGEILFGSSDALELKLNGSLLENCVVYLIYLEKNKKKWSLVCNEKIFDYFSKFNSNA